MTTPPVTIPTDEEKLLRRVRDSVVQPTTAGQTVQSAAPCDCAKQGSPESSVAEIEAEPSADGLRLYDVSVLETCLYTGRVRASSYELAKVRAEELLGTDRLTFSHVEDVIVDVDPVV